MSYGQKVVVALTGINYRRLDYWTRTGIIRPAKAAAGKGTRREFSFQDLVALKVAKRLRDEGITLQKIRKAITFLRKNFPDVNQPLTELRFITDGATVFMVDRDPQVIIDTLKGGQLVIALALGELIEDMKGELKRLATPLEEKVEVDGHTFTVVLTPDLEDGGFTVQCKEEPAAISQGETEQEAIDNIIDALELCLEHEREFQASKTGEAQAG
jgi:DNA-binding transcriptional MerR regulator